MKTLAIALNSFKDAIRQKILILFMLIAFALIILSRFVLGLNIGLGQMSFVADFGIGALSFFGVIIAIVATSQLMHSEYDNKSIFLILSKSVSPLDFISGKFLGISFLIFIYCFGISILSLSLLYYTQCSLEDVPEALLRGGRQEVNFLGFFAYAFLQFLKLSIVSLLTLLICCVSKTILFSIIISACIYMICVLLSSSIFDLSATYVYEFTSNIFPNLAIFDSAKSFIFEPINFTLFSYALSYALVYIFVIILLAAYIFSKREF